MQSTTCNLPQTLAPLNEAGDHDYDCTFTVLVTPSNDSPNPVVDTVTATLDPDVGTNFTVQGSASATVFLPQPAP